MGVVEHRATCARRQHPFWATIGVMLVRKSIHRQRPATLHCGGCQQLASIELDRYATLASQVRAKEQRRHRLYMHTLVLKLPRVSTSIIAQITKGQQAAQDGAIVIAICPARSGERYRPRYASDCGSPPRCVTVRANGRPVALTHSEAERETHGPT